MQRLCQQLRDHPERISLALEVASVGSFADMGPLQKTSKPLGLPEDGGNSLMRAAQEAQRECHRPPSSHALHGSPLAAHTFLASYAKRGSLRAPLAQALETSPTMTPVDDIATGGGPGASEGMVESQAAEDAARASGECGCSSSKDCRAVSSLLSARRMAVDVSRLVITCPEEGVSRPRTVSPPQFTSGALAPRLPCHHAADGRDRGSLAQQPRLSSPRRPLRFAQSKPQLESFAGNAIFALAPCQNRMVARRCALTQAPALPACPTELCRMPQMYVTSLPQKMIKCASTGALHQRSQHSPDYLQRKGLPAECALPVGCALKRQMSLPRITSFKPVVAHVPQESTPSGISCVVRAA